MSRLSFPFPLLSWRAGGWKSFCLGVLASLPCFPLFADTELNVPGYRLVWSDEFEGTVVDSTKWDVNVGVNAFYQRQSDGRVVEPHWFNEPFEPWISAGTINGERQYYSPENVTQSEGVLRIRADRETVSDPVGLYDPGFHQYTSGKLNTADEFQFRFGIVKWRARLPAGQGLWPALWMLNAPEPHWFWDDEIDVMEARGSQPNITTSAHHFKVVNPDGSRTNFYNTQSLDAGFNLQESFNVYGLEWNSERLRTTLNETEVFVDTERVPQDAMFLIMNAAVGGLFDGEPSADVVFPTFFDIDWVRVWQPAPHPTDLANGGFENHQGAQWADWNTVDDGNLFPVKVNPLQGAVSVRITPSTAPLIADPRPNLLAEASEWRGYLNEFDADFNPLHGGPVDPASIPATTGDQAATIGLHQTSTAPVANAVVYRELGGAALLGRDLTFSGDITIEEPFPAENAAVAFVRIFDSGFNFVDFFADASSGGAFSLSVTIPPTNVSIVQFGLETTGTPGSAGRLTATDLFLADDAEDTTEPVSSTGFSQTVLVETGQTVRFGVLASNDPTAPLTPGAEGQLRIDFLDTESTTLLSLTEVLIESDSPSHAVPFTGEATAPDGAAFARLTIERVTIDAVEDAGGSFLADVAFLHVVGDTELPELASAPPQNLTVIAGDTFTLPIETVGTAVPSLRWYRDGVALDTAEEPVFVATPDISGRFYTILENSLGPVIGSWTDVVVETPDTDSDGLIDYDENVVHGTDPTNPDTDGDGIDDFLEIFRWRTDPKDPQSRIMVMALAPAAEQIDLTFTSSIGVGYQFEASANLESWQSVGTPLRATQTTSMVSIEFPENDPPFRFLRIVVEE